MASGLTFRTLDWHLARPAKQQAELRIGIKPDREKEVLAAWHKKVG